MAPDRAPELVAGPQRPITSTPAPANRSMRRTWSIDIAFPEGLDCRVVADVRGRDLRTDADGSSDVLDELAVVLELDPATGTVVAVEVGRAGVPLDPLHGVSVRAGFGRRLAELFPHELARRSLCFGALEDLGGAQHVSGYAHLVEGVIPPTREVADAAVDNQSDICIGWAADGAFIQTTRARGFIPVPIGPAAPDLGSDAPHGWHDMKPMTHPATRRRRRLDVFGRPDQGGLGAQEHFRDSYAARGGETVMHEYLVDAGFDGERRLASVDVDARVLPWNECPGAVAGAQRLVGVSLDELAVRVRSDLRGVISCTHLNSTLRTLADVRALADALDG